MRVLECPCGARLEAESDSELEGEVKNHVAESHPDMEMTDDRAREMVAAHAQDG